MHIECKEPLVSVIMPAFNAAKYIQNAIDSVIAQTFTNWELLIVDDGSTDDSVAIIKRNVEKYSRIKVFQQQHSNKVQLYI
jgi:teichuronic acid biosynthesis glycosyltransferase TuaG